VWHYNKINQRVAIAYILMQATGELDLDEPVTEQFFHK
jgi:ABC-type cobalamin/Fe3+-siderophores transport system ATPase subunit